MVALIVVEVIVIVGELMIILKRNVNSLASLLPCHRKLERCFHIKGKPLPICARCFSILIGYTSIPFLFLVHVPFWIGIFCQIPIMVDGYTQLRKWRTSNNTLRLITGLVSGVGLSIGIVEMVNFLVFL